jgi:diguanylate cyclase (GGDEF)-like protein
VKAASLNGKRQRAVTRGTAHPRRWTLWTRPRSVIVYVLLGELAIVSGCVYAIVSEPAPGRIDWFRFAVLVACATAHIQLSRRQEERRRNRLSNVHVDLTAIWVFPAVLVLPLSLALLLLLTVRVQRWFAARRPLYRFTFSSASMASAALVTHAMITWIGPLGWSLLDGVSSARELLVLVALGLVYSGVQVVVIGIIAALNTPPPTVQKVLGTKEDNELEAITVALGMLTAILLVNMPAALVIMVVLGVIGNRIAEVRQLQVDVRTDSKTGLLNMRGWREAAERALERSSRANSPSAVLMVDLDHFKSINDTWGHPAGDNVLEVVATALRGATRPADVIGRFGGEEFVVLLPDVDTPEAVAAGERIRETVSGLQVPTTDKRGGPVAISGRTTSVGIAIYPHHGSTLNELLRFADAAVYEAKENGRDQVKLATDRPRSS